MWAGMWRASLPALARVVAPAERQCCSPAYPVFARCLSAGALPPLQQHHGFHHWQAAEEPAGAPGGASPAAAATIFALSSGQGRSAVAVIRLSGPGTDATLSALLPRHRPLPPPRTLSLATLRHPHSREELDRGLVARFPAPASFTGEDCAELHVHGGPAVVCAVLDALGVLPWARPAEAGEFSRRAFEAGKLDLTEVEGLADLLRAETEAQRRQALAQSGGAVRRAYEGWRATLLKCLARVEAVIDFGEDEGIADEVAAGVVPLVAQLRAELVAHLAVGDAGELVREGVRVAIVGPPNAGKSSLLNALAGRDAAIVSPIPGTTRDTVEVALDLGGYKVLVTDSAGLRDTADPIEAEGVRRAQAAVQLAHVVLLLLDAAALSAEEEASNQGTVGAVEPECPGVSTSGRKGGGCRLANDSGGRRLAVAEAYTQQQQPAKAPDQQQQQQHQPHAAEWREGELRQLAAALSSKPSGCVVEAFNKLDALTCSSREAFMTKLGSQRRLVRVPSSTLCTNKAHTAQQGGACAPTEPPAAPAPAQPPIGISVATGEGLEQLLAKIQAAVAAAVRASGDPASAALVARARHRHHLAQCVRALERYAAAPLQVEIAAEELRAAAKALGRVTGAIDTESVLDSVFSEFCIGK